jgi:hypothetical protein
MRNNNMLNGMAKAICMVVIAAAVHAPSAQAIVFDPGVITKMQQQRDSLIVREKGLLQDYDTLSRQIDDMCRRNDGSLDRRIDDLNRERDSKFADIKQIRLDLHDVEMKMM